MGRPAHHPSGPPLTHLANLKTILWADCLRKQLVILLAGPQGDPATVLAGLASWKSDRPALQRHNRLASFSSLLYYIQREARSRRQPRAGSRSLQGSACEIRMAEKTVLWGCHFQSAVCRWQDNLNSTVSLIYLGLVSILA